ncbi:hypothetical protein AMECASPLE_031150 [Ameca splendens]|uniref:Uncharacterized protein n=1 Tax=Ameca splendens TaxID=208324 RepID=A0ABV0XJ93_9TELE
MCLEGSPMANSLWVTGQTKSISRRLYEDHKIEARDVARYGGTEVTTLKPGLGSGLVSEHLVAGLLFAGPSRAKPKRETQGHTPVGPPPAGGTMRDWSKEATYEGGDLDSPISRCLGWL